MNEQIRATREAYAYACPAGCGCLWRDNKNGTMSLYGINSKSCHACEPAPLHDLIPVYQHQNKCEVALSDAVKNKRGKKGIRQAAKDIGVSPTTLSKVERGHMPDAKTLLNLREWLGMSFMLTASAKGE